MRDKLFGNHNSFACLWIASHPFRTVIQFKYAESPDFCSSAILQAIRYGFEYLSNRKIDIRMCEIGVFSLKEFYQL